MRLPASASIGQCAIYVEMTLTAAISGAILQEAESSGIQEGSDAEAATGRRREAAAGRRRATRPRLWCSIAMAGVYSVSQADRLRSVYHGHCTTGRLVVRSPKDRRNSYESVRGVAEFVGYALSADYM